MTEPQFTMATCFSGIGAPELGAEGKFEPIFAAEIEPFPASVLAARFGASAPRFMPSPDDPDLEEDDRKARRAAIKATAQIESGSRMVNLGDVSNPSFIDDALALGKIDLLVGGPPCQAFSFAGLRQSLGDDRGNLSLRFVEIAHAIRPRILLVENVPGWLSTDDNAFGCFLGAIVGGDAPLLLGAKPRDGRSNDFWKWRQGGTFPVLDDEGGETGEFVEKPTGHVCKWPDSGMAAGPRSRVAWRIFDAQYFGLAQRRRRVFAVVSFGDDDPARILFEPKRLQGNSKPRRESRESGELAGTLSARTKGGGGLGTDFELDGGIQPVAARMTAFGEYEMDETASTLKARDWKDATDLVINAPPDLAGTLKGEGFDATEDGSGKTTLIPQVVGTICADSFTGGAGGRPEGAAAGHFVPIALSSKDDGLDNQSDVTPTLRALNNANSKPNGGGALAVAFAIQERAGAENLATGPSGKGYKEEVAFTLEARRPQSVAFAQNQRDEIRTQEVVGALAAEPGMKQQSFIAENLAVRRLTPTECERLQGFPDGFTAIDGKSFRKISAAMAAYMKPDKLIFGEDGIRTRVVADGPRYKALGNSWAVPCGRWIINRIYLEMRGELK